MQTAPEGVRAHGQVQTRRRANSGRSHERTDHENTKYLLAAVAFPCCAATYERLEVTKTDLHAHINLENYILFVKNVKRKTSIPEMET
jgi:iron-sulfur cluster repair protein YtfE (RIC family)